MYLHVIICFIVDLFAKRVNLSKIMIFRLSCPRRHIEKWLVNNVQKFSEDRQKYFTAEKYHSIVRPEAV